MLVNPACIGQRRHVNETDFERLLRRGQRRAGLGKRRGETTSGHDGGCEVFIHGSPLHDPDESNAALQGSGASQYFKVGAIIENYSCLTFI